VRNLITILIFIYLVSVALL